MKSYFNRGKSLNQRYAHIFNPIKDRNGITSSFGGVFSMNSSSYGNNNNNENFQ